MAAQTPAEQALSRSYTPGGGQVRFEVTDLLVEHHRDRSVTLTYRLTAIRGGCADERWEFTLPWDDKSFADVFTSAAPDPDRLTMLVHLVRASLEEWWDTKAHNRQLAKMGRKLS